MRKSKGRRKEEFGEIMTTHSVTSLAWPEHITPVFPVDIILLIGWVSREAKKRSPDKVVWVHKRSLLLCYLLFRCQDLKIRVREQRNSLSGFSEILKLP